MTPAKTAAGSRVVFVLNVKKISSPKLIPPVGAVDPTVTQSPFVLKRCTFAPPVAPLSNAVFAVVLVIAAELKTNPGKLPIIAPNCAKPPPSEWPAVTFLPGYFEIA